MRLPLLAVLSTLLFAGTVRAQESRCKLDSLATWASVNRDWSNEGGTTWTNDSLRRVLIGMAKEYQQLERRLTARTSDSTRQHQLADAERRLTERFSSILDEFGLPTRSMVGAAGSSAAFQIVQHNDSLQSRVLTLARSAWQGDVPPASLAMIEDRVLVQAGKPQKYGTQFTAGPDGVLRFAPADNPERLEERRSLAGLPPLDTFVCLLEEGGMKVDRSTLPAPP
jgi:hypothetical protein